MKPFIDTFPFFVVSCMIRRTIRCQFTAYCRNIFIFNINFSVFYLRDWLHTSYYLPAMLQHVFFRLSSCILYWLLIAVRRSLIFPWLATPVFHLSGLPKGVMECLITYLLQFGNQFTFVRYIGQCRFGICRLQVISPATSSQYIVSFIENQCLSICGLILCSWSNMP